MGMVWIGYEQTEQLREYGVKMRVSVPHIVSEAIDQWLKYVAPARLKVHGGCGANSGIGSSTLVFGRLEDQR
jgi:hypothetical protein